MKLSIKKCDTGSGSDVILPAIFGFKKDDNIDRQLQMPKIIIHLIISSYFYSDIFGSLYILVRAEYKQFLCWFLLTKLLTNGNNLKLAYYLGL